MGGLELFDEKELNVKTRRARLIGENREIDSES